MTSYRALLIVSLLLIGRQETSAKIQYGIEDAINDIGSVIPGSKFVLTSAVKIWLLYGEINELIGNGTGNAAVQLQQFEKKLDQIDLSLKKLSGEVKAVAKDVKDLKYTITDKVLLDTPKKLSLDSQLEKFAECASRIDSNFKEFELLTSNRMNINNITESDFVDRLLSGSAGSLSADLHQMARLLTDRTSSYNLIDILTDEHMIGTLICSRQESPLHQIASLYRNIMQTEMKSLFMVQYAYAVKQKQSNGTYSYSDELFIFQELAFRRISKIVWKMKMSMNLAKNEYWMCHSEGLEKGQRFTTLGPIFQKYLINEKYIDDKDRFSGDCGKTCERRVNGTERYEKNKNIKGHEHIRCPGRLLNCEKVSSKVKLCLSDKNSGRRYEFLEDKTGEKIIGKKGTCRNDMVTYGKKKKKIGILLGKENMKCDFCLCTCLVNNNDESVDRYFNLRDVTSDVDKNKIVTGVRFKKQNKIFHIQIQQGLLGKRGFINETTLQWKSVDNYTVSNAIHNADYHTVTWEERTVNLDDILSKNDSILTGLRFKQIEGGIKLEIQVTPFNFTSGELYTQYSEWLSNPSDTPRDEINMENLKPSSPPDYEYLKSVSGQSLKFTTSSIKEDAGQTVVPFIDLKSVHTQVPVALSGAGLIHKSHDEDSAGFLAFKLFTYNFASHLE